MTPLERRSSATLACIFALRMLGLFLVLPVFALEAAHYPGGNDPALIGLAMGIYGLTQGVLQIPFGLASDRFGRKRVIVLGLLIFALGSFVAALAGSLTWLIVGRSLQGAGAISAAVTALLADQTRDEVRTKAMALVGASIGLMFALSLVMAPLLSGWIGLHGLFALTGVLALAGIGIVVWWVPAEPVQHKVQPRGRLAEVLRHPGLLRLDFGVFVLHAVQLAMWVAIPALLVQARAGQGPPLAGLPAGRAGLFRGDGRHAVPAGAPRLPARCVPGGGGPGGTGADRPARHCARPRRAGAGAAAVRLLLRLQHTGSQPAQHGFARGAAACARRGAGGLQHPAIAGFFLPAASLAGCWPRTSACRACSPPARA